MRKYVLYNARNKTNVRNMCLEIMFLQGFFIKAETDRRMQKMRRQDRISERRIQSNRLSRCYERRRNVLLFLTTVCLALSLTFTFSGFMSNAKELETPGEHKYYTSILIREGDTLWSIARTYMDLHYSSEEDYIRELCRINRLSDEELRAGMYLIIPYFSQQGFLPAAGYL